MASSELVRAMLGGYGGGGLGSGVQDPATLRALQRTGLAQAMLSQGMESGPAYPAQALGRLAQTLAGSFMLDRGMGDLDSIAKDRESGAQDVQNSIYGGGMAPQVPATPVQPQSMATQPMIGARGRGSNTRGEDEGGPPRAGTPGAEVAQRTYDFWKGQGYNDQQVAGIMAGGPGSESDFTPTVFGDKGTSYGLYQHHGPRYEAMKAKYGTDKPTEQQQNEYAAWEMSPQGPYAKVGEALKGAKTASEAATIYTRDFGVPGDKTEIDRRARGAGRFVGLYGGDQPPAAGGNAQYAQAGNVATDASAGGGAAPQAAAGAYESPEIKAALAKIQIAQRALSDPRYQYNPRAHEIAKAAIEQGKTELQVAMHLADKQNAATSREDERNYQKAQKQDERAYQQSQHTPQTVTMLDPGGKGTGIYERVPGGGVGKRIGDAPKQPGESTGPFSGTGMDAQVNNVLLSIGPKIASGTATQPERDQYSLAYQHMMNGQIMPVPDPTDPTGQRQVLARIPGAVPPQFPKPDFTPAPAASATQPAVQPAPTSPEGTQAQPSASGQPAPQVIPGTTRTPADLKLTEDERKAAGFALRMQDAVKDINRLEDKGIHSGNWGSSLAAGVPVVGNSLLSPDFQVYQQRASDWVRAKLRRESGAVIGEKEMADEIKTYFPERGDSPEKIAAKRRSREAAQIGMDEGAGRAHIDPARMPDAAPAAGIPAPPPGFRLVQ